MSNLIPPKVTISFALLLVVALVGCNHQKTQRGHLFRGDWAIEYNRTPWVGCPPDSGYRGVGYQEPDKKAKKWGLFTCLTKENSESNDKNRKRFRHHCAQNGACSTQEPCCRTLGCGMWIDPEDPTTFATLGGTARACGLLPFCTPQKPCCLTPNCGRPVSVNVNPQTLMMTNQNASTLGRNVISGITPGNAAMMQGVMQDGMQSGMNGSTAIIRGMNPTGTLLNGMTPSGILPNGVAPSGMLPNGMPLNGTMSGGIATAVPGVTLVSRGIVPGASAITSGGMVAAIGVATPSGMMTPVGVRLPNGVVNNAIVLRACVMTPNCTAARPCCLTPNCGGAVAVNMVANNATVLASALQAQGVAGNVMQAGGMGMLVNPITNQPINGLTMSGYPQAGYPPIGYAPTGYAPGYPRYAAGMVDTGEMTMEQQQQQQEEEEIVLPSETRSSMPVPRFHAIPTKPTFQRTEGMPQPTRATTNEQAMSEKELEAALDQAYLEGVSAAMDDVERKLDAKRQTIARARLQEKILQQSESLQQQLNAEEEMRMLAIQHERQLQQQAMQQQALHQQALRQVTKTAAVPQRVASLNTVASARSHPQPGPANGSAAQLVENLKTSVASSVASGVNEIFAPLLGTNQAHQAPTHQANQTYQRGQTPATAQPRHIAPQVTEQAVMEVAVAPSELPGRPPVSPVTPNYGLLSDKESEALIMQAQFSDDGTVIRP